MFGMNQGRNEDDSQSNAHTEAGLLKSGQEDRHSTGMGVQRECEVGQDNMYIYIYIYIYIYKHTS